MSEKTTDNEIEIIESETTDVIENEPQTEPKVIKKGSFLSVFAVILAISALSLNAYQYIESNKNKTNIQDNDKPWELALQNIESQVIAAAKQNNQTTKSLKNNLSLLEGQIKQLSQDLKKHQDNIKSSAQTPNNSNVTEQLSLIQNQLKTQRQSINKFESQLLKNKQESNQSLLQITDKVTSIQKGSTTQAIKKDTTFEITDTLLHQAYIQLNIKNNLSQGKALLEQVQTNLVKLVKKDPQYQRINTDLISFHKNLSLISLPDTTVISNQINDLIKLSENLPTKKPESLKEQDENLAWYEKLVVIRKVDDKSETKLSNGEQNQILQRINLHYQRLNLALYNKNKKQWEIEINQLIQLHNKHFTDASENIQTKLRGLKAIDIAPKIPDLQPYVQTLRQIGDI